MKPITYYIFLVLLVSLVSCKQTKVERTNKNNLEHPRLLLTASGVKEIKNNLGTIPLFDNTLSEIKKEVDTEIKKGIDVPIPKDLSGGYTHTTHKKNFITLQKAGVLYQILDDVNYAEYVKQMLLSYAKIYPTLPVHPQERSYARGKIFWQCLNDANWLVYVSQAYDCVYNYLSVEERKIIENDLLIPVANYISIENPQFFNRIHNHSTWGTVAVGMLALVLDNDELLQRALYGIPSDNLSEDMRDNDGGYIKKDGQDVGFLANLEEPFSPDGYYTEGPYYQRYAMYPFLVFAQALQNNKPDLKIFKHKNSVLLNGVTALINLSNKNGEFFTLNDAQKGMSIKSNAVVTAVDIAYKSGNRNPALLSIAQQQNKVTLNDAGLAVALDLTKNIQKPFVKKSVEYTDGNDGKQGAVGVLRLKDLEVVFKYTSHGLSHGHYDKLSYSFFNNGDEVAQDYGMARYVNIEQKGGGNYLKENKTWSKQTIAHNTVTQNQQSHFNGKYKIASENHSDRYLFDVNNPNIKVASAKDNNAYNKTSLHRTLALIHEETLNSTFLLDIFKISSNKTHSYDLPLHYLGQLIQTNFDYQKHQNPKVFGTENGYQHLYEEANYQTKNENISTTWLHKNKLYTYTTLANEKDSLFLTRIGANDPDYNLRSEPSIIHRKKGNNILFTGAIEPHGSYNTSTELATNAYSHIKEIKTIVNTQDYTAVEITFNNKVSKMFVIANNNNDSKKVHELDIQNKKITWTGTYTYIEIH